MSFLSFELLSLQKTSSTNLSHFTSFFVQAYLISLQTLLSKQVKWLKAHNTHIWYIELKQSFQTSYTYPYKQEARAFDLSNLLILKNHIFLQNRASSANHKPQSNPLVRFVPNHFKHILNNTPKLPRPFSSNCNCIFKLHHFWILSLQVEFYRDIQAISKQTKHWGRLREHQASSKEPQALLKVAALPYSSLTETGIFKTSISLFRNH